MIENKKSMERDRGCGGQKRGQAESQGRKQKEVMTGKKGGSDKENLLHRTNKNKIIWARHGEL